MMLRRKPVMVIELAKNVTAWQRAQYERNGFDTWVLGEYFYALEEEY